MLYKLILQNLDTLDFGSASFELKQLNILTHISFAHERHVLKITPNIAGEPNKLHKLMNEVTKGYKPFMAKKHKKDLKRKIHNIGRHKKQSEGSEKLKEISKLSKERKK